MSQEQPDQNPENIAEGIATGTADAKAAPEVMPSVEELLRKAELAAQEHHDAWLRAKAETENMRKRAVTDVANAHKYAVENFATELLAVKDSLEAALAVETATVESLKSGAELTLKQLSAAFEKFKLRAQPRRSEIRSASPSGNQHGRSRCRTEHRGAGAAEGLCAARPRGAPGAGDRGQGPGRLKTTA